MTLHLSGLTFGYADPPYIGQARKHYGEHADYAGEVDHEELIERLQVEFPAGWALSLSGQSLQHVLSLCPDDVRVCAWFKPWSNMLPGIRMQYSWEPVIVCGGRKGPHAKGDALLRDWVMANPDGFTFRPIAEGAVIGRKPERFCFWLFDALGLGPGDTLVDLFPGNGAVAQSWTAWLAAGCPRLRQTVKGEYELTPRGELARLSAASTPREDSCL
jgi:hypothetical protein